MNYFIHNATLVNEGQIFVASVFISGGKITKIIPEGASFDAGSATVVEAQGLYLIPGVIDEHVHFREPGLTHKADIHSESRAAVAGGVTSFMDMPNTIPQTVTQELLEQKFELAAEKSLANYSFYLGATNDNLDEVVKTDPKRVCGIKLFMGSSTGNMLVDKNEVLVRLFRESPCLIAAHCEDEQTIHENTVCCKDLASKGEVVVDASIHPFIRTTEACYRSSSKAVDMAEKFGARMHVLHVTTQMELYLFRKDIPMKEKRITAYHEAGHAILFHVLPDVGPVHTVSIIPTGMGAAGYTMPLPAKDEMFLTRGKMLQEIMVSLGGRIAEELIFDDVTTGASSDIQKATAEARKMVTRYGFSANIGTINYEEQADDVFLGYDLGHASKHSELMAGEIDREVKAIIDSCYQDAKKIIEEHMDVLNSAAELLVSREKLTGEEFEALFNPKVAEDTAETAEA